MPMLRLMLFLLIALATGCSGPPEAQRLRETIAAMQDAMEKRVPRDFMEHVSADFVGNDGAFDRETLHNLLRGAVLQNARIGVTLGPLDVDVQGSRATVKVSVTLTGGSGGLIPERGAIYSLTTGWKKEGNQWFCYNASWQQQL
jgi:hypothetical protein